MIAVVFLKFSQPSRGNRHTVGDSEQVITIPWARALFCKVVSTCARFDRVTQVKRYVTRVRVNRWGVYAKNTTQRYLSFRVREEENLGKWTDNSTSNARLQLQIGFNTILQKEVLKQFPQKNDENFFAGYNLTIIDGQRADYLKIWSC